VLVRIRIRIRIKSVKKSKAMFKRISNKPQKRLTMCKKCFTFNYRNTWQFYRPEYLNTDNEDEVFVKFTKCPACMEEESALYESDSTEAWS
jgi:hypothetical protein